MSSSIRFTQSSKRPPNKHSSSKQPSLVLNGTPVTKVTGSALQSSPRNRPSRITTHLAPSSTTFQLTAKSIPSKSSATSSSSSSLSSKSPHHSFSSSTSSSSSSSSPLSCHSAPPSQFPLPVESQSSPVNSPARRPRTMHPIPELTLPEWDYEDLDPQHPFQPLSPSSASTASTSPSEQPVPTSPEPPQTFFIHNGFRYDGEVFELRPPQERSIASRPERILEHRPALLTHRQQFNRVYSEGTYNARPNSLRQMADRASSRFSTDELRLPLQSESLQIDLPGCEPVPLPVTRPGSTRPGPDSRPLHARNAPENPPTSAESLCESIDRVRLAASASGDIKLQGLLAYSAVPVTKITGERPAPHITKAHHVVSPHRIFQESLSAANLDENRRPPAREKRGRSYTSFAKNTPYINGVFKDKDREKERRPSLWKMFTR